MKLVIDVYGGDNAPKAIVEGAVDALNAEQGFSLVLCGKQEEILQLLKDKSYDKSRIEIVDAQDIITNDDVPSSAILEKKESSLVKALNYLSENEDAKGFVSAGSTGAVLTGAVLLLKRIKGINRPALSPVLPTITDSSVLLIDCGANVEPKPLNIVQFAVMGSAFMKSVMGIESPRVGLLSNGAEDSKGTALNKEAFPLLSNAKINFVGNVEGRELLSGDIDVMVSDGYSGNICLKSCEGTALSMFEIIKQGIMKGGLRAKLGYLLLKPVLKGVKKKLDYTDNGGAVLLGLQKIVIKSHGSSQAKAIKNSILQAKQMVDKGVVEKISEAAIG